MENSHRKCQENLRCFGRIEENNEEKANPIIQAMEFGNHKMPSKCGFLEEPYCK